MEMTLFNNDCLEQLKQMPDECIDSVVTDPPYGLSFMGKKWDYQVPAIEIWKEVFRVLKPGGHALIACGTRTQHRMAVNIEDAGFEIRDVITWLYGSGFPKSMDISKAIDKQAGAEREILGKSNRNTSHGNQFADGNFKDSDNCFITAPATDSAKQWQGWGTALKPACEFWTLARKPLSEKTVASNVLKHGTGGINIDESRVSGEGYSSGGQNKSIAFGQNGLIEKQPRNDGSQGRWPANLILDEEAAMALDEQSGILKSGSFKEGQKSKESENKCMSGKNYARIHKERAADSGGASRFFYVAKASKSERNKNCNGVLSWENVDLGQLTEELSQHLKDISEDIVQTLKDSSWSTDLYGHSISEQYPKGLMFTISAAINLITELKTSNYSANSNTKESILGAIRMIEESGLSLVESVASIEKLNLVSINEKTASLLGASLAVLKTLLKIKDCGRLGNVHSTVKPIKLMEYLCKMITPPNGIVLDPFMGSGSTGIAAKKLGFGFVGIERESEYFGIAQARMERVVFNYETGVENEL